MFKQQINLLPEYFDRYISCVPDIDLTDALSIYGYEMINTEKRTLSQIGHNVYAPGKWTIRDILQHLIDTERIFAYRALRIARYDQTPLAGFDENEYVKNAHASGRKLNDLIEEFDIVRQSTTLLYKGRIYIQIQYFSFGSWIYDRRSRHASYECHQGKILSFDKFIDSISPKESNNADTMVYGKGQWYKTAH